MHNALMKIYVNMNNNRPEECYKRGMCDDEIIDGTNRHGLYTRSRRTTSSRAAGPRPLGQVLLTETRVQSLL